ncbi:uncharacterized protein LOC144988889 isoform X1 [Oryzias latipes]
MQRGGGKDKRDEDEVFLSVTASVTFVESNVGEKQLRSFLLLSVGTNGCKVKPGTLKEEEEKGVPLTPTPRGNSLRRVGRLCSTTSRNLESRDLKLFLRKAVLLLSAAVGCSVGSVDPV